jgi:hypothetical protein
MLFPISESDSSWNQLNSKTPFIVISVLSHGVFVSLPCVIKLKALNQRHSFIYNVFIEFRKTFVMNLKVLLFVFIKETVFIFY